MTEIEKNGIIFTGWFWDHSKSRNRPEYKPWHSLLYASGDV